MSLDTRMGLNTPDEGLVGSSITSRKQRRAQDLKPADALKVQLERRKWTLNIDRATWWQNWMDLGDHFRPYRGRWFMTSAVDQNMGWRRNWKIVDSTPLQANNVLAAGMLAGACSPSRPWFSYKLSDEEMMEAPGVKEWLAQVTKTNREILADSNFYPQMFECLGEFGVFGMIALGKEWPRPKSGDPDLPNFYSFTIGSYYVGHDEQRRVNTFFRDFRWTVEQVVQKFVMPLGPLDEDASWVNVSRYVRGMWFQGLKDQWVDLVHAIVENRERAKGSTGDFRADVAGMRFQSVYYERGGEPDKVLRNSDRKSESELDDEKKMLRLGGFRDFPVLTARWYTNSEDVWARGPAMDALGDARALQLQQRRKAQAIDKVVDPPMRASPELRNQRTSQLPGDVTYVVSGQAGVGFEPLYEVKPDLSAFLEDIKETQDRIKMIMFSDIFAMFIQAEQTGQPITAAEVNAKQQEKLLMLGPVLEQLNGMFNHLHEWLFARGLMHGKYPPMPPAMKGQRVMVQYTSILAQAINQVTAGALQQFLNFVGEIAKVAADADQNPHLDKVDFDKMIEEEGKATGVPPVIIRPDSDVDAIRRHRQQMQAQAAQQQAAAQAAQNLGQHADTAQTLSQTPAPGGGGQNLLDLLGAATGSQPVAGR